MLRKIEVFIILWILVLASLMSNAYMLHEHMTGSQEKRVVAPYYTVTLKRDNITVCEKQYNVSLDGLLDSTTDEWNDSIAIRPLYHSIMFKHDSESLYGAFSLDANLIFNLELYFKGDGGSICLGIEQLPLSASSSDSAYSIEYYIENYENGDWGDRIMLSDCPEVKIKPPAPLSYSGRTAVEFAIPIDLLSVSHEDTVILFAYRLHYNYGYDPSDNIHWGGQFNCLGEPTNFSTYSPMTFEENCSISSPSRSSDASSLAGGGY